MQGLDEAIKKITALTEQHGNEAFSTLAFVAQLNAIWTLLGWSAYIIAVGFAARWYVRCHKQEREWVSDDFGIVVRGAIAFAGIFALVAFGVEILNPVNWASALDRNVALAARLLGLGS